MNRELESLMRDVGRAVVGDAQRRNVLPQVQAGLAQRAPRTSSRRALLWAGALSAAACAGVAVFAWKAPHAVSFSVGGEPAGGQVGAPIVAPPTAPLAVAFSDGSTVTLPPRTTAHVDALERDGATLALDDGTVEVSVIHRAHTRWQVRAGAYRIQVTGTRFAAGWDRRAQVLTVTMHDGGVTVVGPGIAEPIRVVTGQRLRASASGVDLGLENVSASPPSRSEPPPPPPLAPEPAAEPGPAHLSRARHVEPTRGTTTGLVDWRVAAARAEYPQALAAAVQAGWHGQCARLGADDLVLLGDVARLAGDLPRAEEAYRAARHRFPGADRPVFALGLIAFEARHDYHAAGDLFAAYLRAFPHGPLAREAAGRLIESRLKAGEGAEARAAGAAYLHDFPGGPHTALARRAAGTP
jgi:transmembrane sensor